MPTPARLAGVGVFVLSGLLLFAVGLFMIGDRQMAFVKKFTIYTEFRKITGLQPGAIVRVSGAKAGSIIEILPPSRPSGKFRVKLEIIEELHQLVRTDSLGDDRDGRARGRDVSRYPHRNGRRPAGHIERDDSRQGAVRDRGSHAADERDDQEGERHVRRHEGRDPGHRGGDRRHRRQSERADRRRQRRPEAHDGVWRANRQRRRADRRGCSDRQGHHR